jgi:DNA-binding winged helix-turn-helix (wHTH) protein
LPIRYRFAGFVVSPRRRALTRDGAEVPLIPRYFDLLLLLLERRHDAVHRQDIFTRVWNDVIVSDGALSQAVRTLRRTLGDDSREPIYIRTVARHGYRFVYPDVVEEPDDPDIEQQPAAYPGDEPLAGADVAAPHDPFQPLIDTLLARNGSSAEVEEERRDAAERLHALGTAEALRRLAGRQGHARARALLRDTRWDVPGAGDVPLVGQPDAARSIAALIGLRGRQAWRHASRRWSAAAAGAGAAGALAGGLGGLLLVMLPSSGTPAPAIVVLAVIGAAAGAAGAAGVGAGLATAEALARSWRSTALLACGALGGAIVGLAGHLLVRWTLEGLFGINALNILGPLDGGVLGGAAGAGYALATSRLAGGGMAAPPGAARLRAAALVAICCGIAAFVLAASGRPLVGGLVNGLAQASRGASIVFGPLGRLIGEPEFGRVSAALLGACEGAFFGFGLAFGLTRRPRA